MFLGKGAREGVVIIDAFAASFAVMAPIDVLSPFALG